MTAPEINVWIPVLAALAGALIGSVSPVVVGLVNARAESRRERLRLAVQMAIKDHKDLMAVAREKAQKLGVGIAVPPISAVLAYHVEILEAFERAGTLEPADLTAVGARAKASYKALAGDKPDEL